MPGALLTKRAPAVRLKVPRSVLSGEGGARVWGSPERSRGPAAVGWPSSWEVGAIRARLVLQRLAYTPSEPFGVLLCLFLREAKRSRAWSLVAGQGPLLLPVASHAVVRSMGEG